MLRFGPRPERALEEADRRYSSAKEAERTRAARRNARQEPISEVAARRVMAISTNGGGVHLIKHVGDARVQRRAGAPARDRSVERVRINPWAEGAAVFASGERGSTVAPTRGSAHVGAVARREHVLRHVDPDDGRSTQSPAGLGGRHASRCPEDLCAP